MRPKRPRSPWKAGVVADIRRALAIPGRPTEAGSDIQATTAARDERRQARFGPPLAREAAE